jgi:hypothetical protein
MQMRNKRGFWSTNLLHSAGWCLVLLAAVVPARAANNCPWLNEATASGLLGGEAVGAFQAATPQQPAICTFTERIGGATRTLQIRVETASDSAARLKSLEKSCGSDIAPLPAIGNEAVSCSVDNPGKRTAEDAIGRVRDQVFLIQIGSSLSKDPVLTRDNLVTRIHSAAEEVSGSLF